MFSTPSFAPNPHAQKGNYSDRKKLVRRPALEVLAAKFFEGNGEKMAHIIREYRGIQREKRQVFVDQDALHPVNQAKNRYPDVLPLALTAVKLHRVDGISGSDYINANFVQDLPGLDGKRPQSYICCQAPLVHTFCDFWRMIWEQSISVIVMITNLIERNRIKADTYWPTRLYQTLRFGKLRVKLVREYQRGHNVMIRKFHIWEVDETNRNDGDSGSFAGPYQSGSGSDFSLKFDHGTDIDEPFSFSAAYDDSDGSYDSDMDHFSFSSSSSESDIEPIDGRNVRKVTQLHCTKWPDFGVPESAEVMKDLVHELDLRKSLADHPIVVHCSAGIGRTGTFLAIHMSLEKDLRGDEVDIRDTVRHLRTQRLGMVQSKEQYMFVYAVVAEMLKEKEDFKTLPYRQRRIPKHYRMDPNASRRLKDKTKGFAPHSSPPPRLPSALTNRVTETREKQNLRVARMSLSPTVPRGPMHSTLSRFVDHQRQLHKVKDNSPESASGDSSGDGDAVASRPTPSPAPHPSALEVKKVEKPQSFDSTLSATTRHGRVSSLPAVTHSKLKRSLSESSLHHSRPASGSVLVISAEEVPVGNVDETNSALSISSAATTPPS